MSEGGPDIYERVLDDMRRRAAAEPRSPEWAAVVSDLEAHGIDATDFGLFSSVARTTFDYDAAAPILVEWLSRVSDPELKEAIARSLTGARTAGPGASQALVVEFRNASATELGEKWAYANALATLADAAAADDLLELVRDRRHGRAREMLCDALKRTKDPRMPEALVELIDDDDVAGHAISALRSLGPKRSLPLLVQARPKLEAVLARPTASDFAKRQARRALERVRASSEATAD